MKLAVPMYSAEPSVMRYLAWNICELGAKTTCTPPRVRILAAGSLTLEMPYSESSTTFTPTPAWARATRSDSMVGSSSSYMDSSMVCLAPSTAWSKNPKPAAGST